MSVERAGEVLKALKSSEHPYLQIIYWQCRRETDTNIATMRLNPKVSANYVFQRKKELETAFRTHQVNYPSPEVCEAIEKYFTGPPKFDVREGVTPAPIVIEQTSVDPPPPPPQPDQQSDPTPPRQGPQVIIPPARQTTKREGCLSLPVLLGALLLFVTGLLIWSVLTDESEPVDRIVEVTREIESIVEVTVPPIEVTRIVEVIKTVEVPVNETVVVVQTVPAVEVTKLVEVTPVPTPTPTETPLPQTVTINEDFSDFSLDPAFAVEGEPQYAEGRLSAPSEVTLKIGDETWKNYTVSFFARSLAPDQSYSGIYNTGFSMTVRDKLRSKLRFNGIWSYMNDRGEFVNLVGTEASWRWGISMIVEDDFIYFTDADGNTTTVPNTYSDSGGITITLSNAYLDDLIVTRND